MMVNLRSVYVVIALVSQFKYQLASSSSDVSDIDVSCPIWTIPNKESKCVCGDHVNNIVHCNPTTHSISIVPWHCMTYSTALNKTVVGYCLYNIHFSSEYDNFVRVPGHKENRMLNNTIMCQFVEDCVHKEACTYYQHQTGLMCTNCTENYAYPVYSYSLACVECKDYKYNWLKYIAVAFLPLTVFYIIVILFRITATSGAVNGYILMCQMVATPYNVRLAMKTDFAHTFRGTFTGNAKIFHFSFLGIWNLDFFRGFYTPFCLHPNLRTLQTLMLDYVIAVYPLLLIFLTYISVKLHYRYSIIIRLWSPFYKCFSRFRNNWDINRSLVGAFATFILLSYVKILNVSFYVLTPNTLYDVEGNKMSRHFLYYDGTYEYFGADHIPYAVVALVMLFVFNILPLVLLSLYPCRFFHRCLNYCRIQSLTLHIFMDMFTGCFKSQPRDCRYFAALYLFLRLFNHAMLIQTVGPSYIPLAGFLFTIMIIVIAVIRPHRTLWHTLADVAFFASLSFLFIGLSGSRLVELFDVRHVELFLYSFIVPVVSLQFMYGIGLFIYFLLPKRVLLKVKTLLQHCKLIIKRQTDLETEDPMPYRFYHSDEYAPLLP